jgi:hypothetical protein
MKSKMGKDTLKSTRHLAWASSPIFILKFAFVRVICGGSIASLRLSSANQAGAPLNIDPSVTSLTCLLSALIGFRFQPPRHLMSV